MRIRLCRELEILKRLIAMRLCIIAPFTLLTRQGTGDNVFHIWIVMGVIVMLEVFLGEDITHQPVLREMMSLILESTIRRTRTHMDNCTY